MASDFGDDINFALTRVWPVAAVASIVFLPVYVVLFATNEVTKVIEKAAWRFGWWP